MGRNRKYNILSIDWDFYSDASLSEILYSFPDVGNEDIGELFQDEIWSVNYPRP